MDPKNNAEGRCVKVMVFSGPILLAIGSARRLETVASRLVTRNSVPST